MEYWVVAVVALVLAVLTILIVGISTHARGTQTSRKARTTPPREPCPLCGSPLVRGERVHSELFGGEKERRVHVFGCPHCYPPDDRHPRACPVCRKALADDGYLVGLMWERRQRPGAGGAPGRTRQHLHILGCTACSVSSRQGRT